MTVKEYLIKEVGITEKDMEDIESTNEPIYFQMELNGETEVKLAGLDVIMDPKSFEGVTIQYIGAFGGYDNEFILGSPIYDYLDWRTNDKYLAFGVHEDGWYGGFWHYMKPLMREYAEELFKEHCKSLIKGQKPDVTKIKPDISELRRLHEVSISCYFADFVEMVRDINYYTKCPDQSPIINAMRDEVEQDSNNHSSDKNIESSYVGYLEDMLDELD